MRVKCRYNTGAHLHIERKESEWQRKSIMDLTINKEYIVYGMSYYEKKLDIWCKMKLLSHFGMQVNYLKL